MTTEREIKGPNKKRRKKQTTTAKRKKSQNTLSCSFRFGVSKIDVDIKAFISTIDDEGNISASLKDVLRAFVLNIPYNWDRSAINDEDTKEVRIIKVTISKLNDDLLYSWCKDYVDKTLNLTGVLKNIIHYQLYKDISLIKIDLNQYTSSPITVAIQPETHSKATNNASDETASTVDSIGTKNKKEEAASPKKRANVSGSTMKNVINLLSNVGD